METPADSSRFSLPPNVTYHGVAGRRVTVVKFCWQGKSHVEMGTECQDFADIFPSSPNGDSARLSLVVADGVGTRSRSRKGAEFACFTIGMTFSDVTFEGDRLSDRFARARCKFIDLCAKDAASYESQDEDKSEENTGTNMPPKDSTVNEYATTALVLCLDAQGYWAASVGDGAIYGLTNGGSSARLLTKINREGFSNEVRPLTNDQWQRSYDESNPEFIADESMQGFCLMTDGLSESIGDAGIYFGSIWPELKQRLNDPSALTEYADAYCRYWEDRNFSDDDKTLVAVFLDPKNDADA
jgi:hypothetical protein